MRIFLQILSAGVYFRYHPLVPVHTKRFADRSASAHADTAGALIMTPAAIIPQIV